MTKFHIKEKQMTIKKRGRPVGSKNKPEIKVVKRTNVLAFEKQLEEWDKKEKQVDLQGLCEKLQDALAKAYVDCEKFEKDIATYQSEILRRDVIIQYLESRAG
jgi:pyridoxine/pyridoxamine 5'-phosphate oxidase